MYDLIYVCYKCRILIFLCVLNDLASYVLISTDSPNKRQCLREEEMMKADTPAIPSVRITHEDPRLWTEQLGKR